MNAPLEILDWVETDLGPLCLRRREALGRPGTFITEVTLDHEALMSSLNTVSEEALATIALDRHGGTDRKVLVGGLGLGYTAAAALRCGSVQQVQVIERLHPVVEWLTRGLIPLAEELTRDPRLEVVEGNVYADLLGPARDTWDAILIDVDHSPAEPLDAASAEFYTPAGLARVAHHLAPGGVLGVWSAADSASFTRALHEVFPGAESRRVGWTNELVDDGQPLEDVIFLASRADS